MFHERRLAFPVSDPSGKLQGIVTVDETRGKDPSLPVSAVMRNDIIAITHGDAAALDAFKRMTGTGLDRVIVLDDARHIVGIVTKTDLLRVLQLRSAGLEPHAHQHHAAAEIARAGYVRASAA
jgi:predicted transcriptional regulator